MFKKIVGIAVMLVMAFSVAACIPSEVHDADCDCEICKPADEPHDADCDCETCKPPEELEENEWRSIPFEVHYKGIGGFTDYFPPRNELYPSAFTVIYSLKELQELGQPVSKGGTPMPILSQAIFEYDESFFTDYALVLYAFYQGSSGYPNRVDALDINCQNGTTRVTICRYYYGVAVPAYYTYLIAVKTVDMSGFSGQNTEIYEGYFLSSEWEQDSLFYEGNF